MWVPPPNSSNGCRAAAMIFIKKLRAHAHVGSVGNRQLACISPVCSTGQPVRTAFRRAAFCGCSFFMDWRMNPSGRTMTAPVGVRQFLILGLIFVVLSALYTTIIVLSVSALGRMVRRTAWIRRLGRFSGKVVGALYIGLGLKVAFQRQ